MTGRRKRCRHTSSTLPSPSLSPGISPGLSLTKTLSMPQDLSLSLAVFRSQYLSRSLLPLLSLCLCLWLAFSQSLFLFLLLSLFLFFRSIACHNCHISFAISTWHFIPDHMPDDSYLILRPDVRDSLQRSRGPRSWQFKRWPDRACDICHHKSL